MLREGVSLAAGGGEEASPISRISLRLDSAIDFIVMLKVLMGSIKSHCTRANGRILNE